MHARLLLLEDDRLLNATLKDFLEDEGFGVDATFDPYSAFDLTYKRKYDCYLLDVKLPYESGFDMLSKLRNSGDMTPAMFITSKSDTASLQEGFDAGADDYLKKPVDLDELLCRVRALLKRQTRLQKVPIGEYQFDIYSKKLFRENEEMELSIKAGQLLQLLIEANGRVLSLDEIKAALWSSANEASDGSLRVYITQLKKYFNDNIRNIRGIGYCLEG
ncbi:MAG: response regulator transcription factor [Sulfurovaceae bacterium]